MSTSPLIAHSDEADVVRVIERVENFHCGGSYQTEDASGFFSPKCFDNRFAACHGFHHVVPNSRV
jgi:hypothetical protein